MLYNAVFSLQSPMGSYSRSLDIGFYSIFLFVSSCSVSVTQTRMMVSRPAGTEISIPLLRCGWSHIAIVLSLFVALFPSAPLFVQSTNSSTSFSFPVFLSPDNFLCIGETRYNLDTKSFTIKHNPSQSRLYSDKLVYSEKVRMKNGESNAVASFSTSFTFSITQEDEQFTKRSGWLGYVCGLLFSFASNWNATIDARQVDPGITFLSFEFDTYNSYVDEDPSDNHIGVDINNAKSAYTHNLCGAQRTSCSFPWSGRNYTAWIDYNGSTQSLEIWFANGSMADGDIKPTGSGLIKVPKLALNDVFEEYMYVLFSGNAGPFSDTWEIFSWNFTTSFPEQIPEPTFMLTPNFKGNIDMIVAACGTAVLIAICLLGYWRIGQSHLSKSSELRLSLPMGLRRFSFKELKKATKNFSESALLGKGGSGSVYKGILTESGMAVAVKRLKHDSEHVERQFLAEVSSISQIRHRNLVQLLGWCHEDKHFILVFEYMSNGSLDEWLFPSRRRHPCDPKYKKFEALPWELRFSILAGVAAALEYLHEEWVQCVLHRDIKSSNVLLDEDFNSHLGDFGLARLIDHNKLEKTTLMAGTLGYMAPEMHYTGKATKESDVYSFGILILEVVCGRKPINTQVEDPNENCMLVHNVWRAYKIGNILSAVDPELLILYMHQLKASCSSTAAFSLFTNSTYEPELVTQLPTHSRWVQHSMSGMSEGSIVPLLHLGLQCCLSDPESRPSMRVVKQIIQQLQSSTAEDTMTILNSMPPLPSTMPVYGSVPQVLESFVKATKVPLYDGEASFMRRSSDTISVLRRGFQSDCSICKIDCVGAEE